MNKKILFFISFFTASLIFCMNKSCKKPLDNQKKVNDKTNPIINQKFEDPSHPAVPRCLASDDLRDDKHKEL